MATTSPSLLARLQVADRASPDWQRLHDLYAPLIRHWLARMPGVAADRDDLCQEVLAVVVREIPAFRRQRDGSFRAWLRQVAVNRVRTWRRAGHPQPVDDEVLANLADPKSDLTREWDQAHDQHVVRHLLELVRPDFASATWEAFRRTALSEELPADVAAALGMTISAVIQAKARVLRRLREEADGLMD